MEKVVLSGRGERASYLEEKEEYEEQDEEEVVVVEAVAGLGSRARMLSRTFSFCSIRVFTCLSVY